MSLNVKRIALILSSASLAALAGCEDSAAKQRDAFQQAMTELRADLQVALAGAGGPFSDESSKAQQELNGIVARLGELDGGEPGQQASRSLLAATALRELADMHLAAADNIEASHRAQRDVLSDQIDAMARLRAVSQGLESVTDNEERELLDREFAAAQARAEELQQKIAQVQGPIDEHTAENAANAQEVERLRLEYGNLVRRAQELGHANGFETYQQAAKVDRQADQIEYGIAQREIELAYTLNPEHRMAGLQAQQLQVLMEAIEAARSQVAAASKASQQSIADTQTQINALQREVSDSIKAINAESSDALKTSYEEALGALDKAASQAENAARQLQGNDVHTAKLVAARVREAQGRLHLSRARGLAGTRDLLDRLAKAEGGAAAGDVAAVNAAHAESVQQAQAAYAAATELLSQVQVRSGGTDLDSFRSNLDAATAALSGKPRTESSDEPASLSGGDGGQSGTADSSDEGSATGQFPTADALFKHAASLGKSGEGMLQVAALTHAQTPDGKRRVKVQTDLGEAFTLIDAAMQEQFQVTLVQAMGPAAAAMMPDLSKAKATEQAADRVVYSLTVMGQVQRTVVRKIDGAWMIDADDMSAQEKMMLPMAEQMGAAMSQAAGSLAERIRAGEFATPQDAVAAFGQAMSAGMGGAGAPGGRSGGGSAVNQ